jgi:hypothetical protein
MRTFMRDDLLTMDQLRGVFARARSAIRAAAGGPIDLSILDDPAGDARRGEVASRVSLSILARAGYLRRGLDCPRSFTLQAGPAAANSDDPRLTALVERHELDEGLPVSLPVQTLAQALGVPVDGVEDILLDWSDAGLLHCKVGKRGAFLRLVEPTPPEGAAALASILEAQEGANEERIDAMARYIEAAGCRNAVIARHFGEVTPTGEAGRCGRCDRCAPEGRRTGEVVKREVGPRR